MLYIYKSIFFIKKKTFLHNYFHNKIKSLFCHQQNNISTTINLYSIRTITLLAIFSFGLSLTLPSITHAYTQEEYYRQQQYQQYQQQQQAQQQRLEQERAMQEARNIFNNGMAAFRNKDYYGCINQLSRIEKIMGNNRDYHIAMGESFRQLKNYENAIKYLSRAMQLGAQDFTTLTGLGYSYMDIGNYNGAYKFLVVANNKFSNPDVAWNLGITCDKLGNQQCLLASMKRVISLNPTYGVDPYLFSGFVYSNNKQFENSLNMYLQGLKYYPNDANLNFYAGDIYYASGKFDACVPYLEKAVAVNKTFLDAYYLLGSAYLQLDNLEYAKDECQIMMKLNKDHDKTKDLCSAVQQRIMQKQMQEQMDRDMIQQQADDNQRMTDQNMAQGTMSTPIVGMGM